MRESLLGALWTIGFFGDQEPESVLYNRLNRPVLTNISDEMPRKVQPMFPATARQLSDFGERLRLARLRRRFSAATVAERAGITRSTLHRAEKGDAGVALGTYVSVLRVLGLQADLDAVAGDDELGRKLQDLELPERRTAPRRRNSEGAS